MHESGFVADLAVVLGVAAITGYIFHRLKQPSILGYLAAGIIVGPYLPIPLFADPGRVTALSEFGVVLVMFSVGLEFRLAKFLQMLPVSGATGLLEMGALIAAGYSVGQLLGWTDVQSLFLGTCISISSTMAVSKILENQPLPEHNKRMVYGVLILQDVGAIALIAVMTAVAQGNETSWTDIGGVLGRLSAALVLLIVGGMFVIPRFIRRLKRTEKTEVLVVGAVGLCFSFAYLAESIGYSAALGAFIGGVLVAESGLGHQVEKATASVRDVFVAVFFVSMGMTVEPKVAWDTLPISLLVLSVVVSTQFVVVTLAGTASGNGLVTSAGSGLALGQIGEFAFIIGAVGMAAGLLDKDFQSVLVTVAVFSTLTTSLALKYRAHITSRLEAWLPDRVRRILTVYEAWWSEIRRPSSGSTSRVQGVLVGLVLDALVMATVILSWTAWRGELESTLSSALGLDEENRQPLTVLVLIVALFPPLLTLVLGSRKLAHRLADRIHPDESAARSVFTAAVGLLTLGSLGLPTTFLLGRALDTAYVWPAFLGSALVASWISWQRFDALDSEINSGGLLLLRTIAGQGYDEHRDSHLPPLVTVDHTEPLTLEASHFAVGKTLSSLALRSITGASVVAMDSESGPAKVPTGNEMLTVGMVLYLAGESDARRAAESYLRRGEHGPSSNTFPASEPVS